MTDQSIISIVKWSEVFENADSRKRERLKYYYSPSGCESNGYLNLMCDFPDDGMMAYGVFNALCGLMATLPKGGRGAFLRGDGSPMTVRQIALRIRVEICQLSAALEILASEGVKWVSVSEEKSKSAGHLPQNSGFVQGQGQGQGQGQDNILVEKPKKLEIEKQAEELRQAYPKKVSKKDDLPKIISALQIVKFDELKKTVAAYAKMRVGEDKQFTPSAARWFGKQLWESEDLQEFIKAGCKKEKPHSEAIHTSEGQFGW